MPDADGPLRLGIIGGCLSHQHDIALGELYHRRLAAMAADAGVRRLRVRIARSFELGYVERMDRLLERGELDVVLLHMRSTVVARAALLVREWSGGQPRLRPNPALTNRRHSVPAASGNEELLHLADLATPDAYGGSRPAQDVPPHGRPVVGYRLRDANHALGKMLGLHGWVIDDELIRLDGFLDACRRRNVHVLVMGPTPVALGVSQSALIRQYGEALQVRLAAKGIPFARVDAPTGPSGRPITRADGLHLTAEGHGVVATALFHAGQAYWT